jgi:hypothetical protein
VQVVAREHACLISALRLAMWFDICMNVNVTVKVTVNTTQFEVMGKSGGVRWCRHV